MRNIIWLLLGFAVATAAASCVYQLGYLRGEIAAMIESEVAR